MIGGKKQIKKQINFFKRFKSNRFDLYKFIYLRQCKKKEFCFSNDKLKSGFVFRELLKSYKIFILTVLAKGEVFQKNV